MGKASSAKKVARAARAGGARSTPRKQFSFPLVIGLIMILGVGLVAFAKTSGEASVDAKNPPQPQSDHWHAAYGVYLCDYFSEALNDEGTDLNGIHTHGDSLAHIHPFTQVVAGRNATLGVFLDQVGLKVSDDGIELPDGRTFKSGDTACNGKPADVRVAHWKDARTAPGADKPDDIMDSGFDDISFSEDLGAYTIAFVPEGTDIPPPPESERICEDAIADAGGQAAGECTPEGTDPGSGETTPSSDLPATETSPSSDLPATETSPSSDPAATETSPSTPTTGATTTSAP